MIVACMDNIRTSPVPEETPPTNGFYIPTGSSESNSSVLETVLEPGLEPLKEVVGRMVDSETLKGLSLDTAQSVHVFCKKVDAVEVRGGYFIPYAKILGLKVIN